MVFQKPYTEKFVMRFGTVIGLSAAWFIHIHVHLYSLQKNRQPRKLFKNYCVLKLFCWMLFSPQTWSHSYCCKCLILDKCHFNNLNLDLYVAFCIYSWVGKAKSI